MVLTFVIVLENLMKALQLMMEQSVETPLLLKVTEFLLMMMVQLIVLVMLLKSLALPCGPQSALCGLMSMSKKVLTILQVRQFLGVLDGVLLLTLISVLKFLGFRYGALLVTLILVRDHTKRGWVLVLS